MTASLYGRSNRTLTIQTSPSPHTRFLFKKPTKPQKKKTIFETTRPANMADLATLASLFSDITLHDADPLYSHILEIEFPVSELLSPNTTQVPHLDPPAALATREAPPHDQQRAGVTQSICRLCLAISNTAPTTPSASITTAAARRA